MQVQGEASELYEISIKDESTRDIARFGRVAFTAGCPVNVAYAADDDDMHGIAWVSWIAWRFGVSIASPLMCQPKVPLQGTPPAYPPLSGNPRTQVP